MSKTLLLSISSVFLIFMVLNCNYPSIIEDDGKDGDTGIVTDIEGNVYKTVKIGKQWWMAENLRTTIYNDGTIIPFITDNDEWKACTTGIGAYCYHNQTIDSGSIVKFGALYNWHAVNTGKLAPEGWHVPTDAEWTKLEEYLIAHGYNYDGTTTGNKIAKALAAKTDWESSDTVGYPGNDMQSNNSSGFSALPSGYRYDFGSFSFRGDRIYWWCATEEDELWAYYRNLYYEWENLYNLCYRKGYGFSVRLVKD